jgi:hypothetical protein
MILESFDGIQRHVFYKAKQFDLFYILDVHKGPTKIIDYDPIEIY